MPYGDFLQKSLEIVLFIYDKKKIVTTVFACIEPQDEMVPPKVHYYALATVSLHNVLSTNVSVYNTKCM